MTLSPPLRIPAPAPAPSLSALFIFFFCLAAGTASAQQPEMDLNGGGDGGRTAKIGLALAGGGARGFAHIGVLKIIDSLGIPVDFVAGTSMGGLIGALFSLGYTPDEIEKLALSTDWPDLFSDSPSRESMPFYETHLTGRYQLELEMDGLTPKVPEGLIAGQKISMLFTRLAWPYIHPKSFDDLPIAFRCVAVDLVRAEEVVFSSGSLPLAMRATMSIPSVFNPVDFGDSLLVDGGILNNFPTDVAKSMGADVVIGLNLTTSAGTKDEYRDLLSILDRMSDIPKLEGRRRSAEQSDILINQNLDGYSISDFDSESIPGIIDRGYQAALLARPQLVRLRDSLGLQSPTVKPRDTRSRMPVISQLSVEGAERLSPYIYRRQLGIHEGDTLDLDLLEKRIEEVYALGYTHTITYDMQWQADSTIALNLRVQERMLARLGIGLRYDDYSKIVASTGIIVTSALIPGLRLESELQFLGLTRLHLNLSYPSRTLDMPVHPFLDIRYKDLPVPVYGRDGIQVGELRDRSWAAEAGLVLSLGQNLTLDLGLGYEWMNIAMDTAWFMLIRSVAPTDDRLTLLSASLTFDRLDNPLLPRTGFRLVADAELSSEMMTSARDYGRLSLDAELYLSPWNAHTFYAAGSWLESWRDLPYYKYFRVGGPTNFVGLDYMQAIGSRFLHLRAGYRYRFAGKLHAGLEANVMPGYTLLSSAGSAGSTPMFGGAVSLTADTFIGPVQLMYALGPLSPRTPERYDGRWFFTAGYRF